MKELSFLMFVIALLFGLIVLTRRFTNPNHPDRAVFFVPSRMLFNLLWGSIFYVGYGILMYPDPWIKISLSVLNCILLAYTLLIIKIQKELLNPGKRMPAFLTKFLTRKIAEQEKLDENTPVYTIRKALKILGLATYTPENKEQISQRLDILRRQAAENLPAPYLKTIIHRCEQTLLN